MKWDRPQLCVGYFPGISRYQSTGTSKCCWIWGLSAEQQTLPEGLGTQWARRFLAEGWWLMWFPIPNDVCFWNRTILNYTNSRLIIPSWFDIFCRIVPPYHWYSCGGCFNKLGLIPRGWPSGLYENGVDTKMTNLMGKDFCNAILLWDFGDLWGSNVLDQATLHPPSSTSWGQLGKSGTFDKPSPTELSAFEEAIQWLQCSYFLLGNSFLMGKLMVLQYPNFLW